MVRKVLLLIALIIMVFWLASCQTIQGIGGDITWIGEKGAQILD